MLIVIENIIDRETIDGIRPQLKQASWQSGQQTAGSISSSVKNNQQLDENDDLARSMGEMIARAVNANPTFISAALPAKIYPPKFNKYANGGAYGVHVDSAVMRSNQHAEIFRSDLSATLFLVDPDEYDGGELVIETQFGAQTVKLPAGDMVLYPSSSLHHVTPVTRGERVSSFFWIQSMVRDSEARAYLFDLDQTIQSLRADHNADDQRLISLTGLYHNLLRRWSLV